MIQGGNVKPTPNPAKPCDFNARARGFAVREAGCPLDHCACGTHDTNEEQHKCPEPVCEHGLLLGDYCMSCDGEARGDSYESDGVYEWPEGGG
jgi:hypothetical protein